MLQIKYFLVVLSPFQFVIAFEGTKDILVCVLYVHFLYRSTLPHGIIRSILPYNRLTI